jgi:hypothetical protein
MKKIQFNKKSNKNKRKKSNRTHKIFGGGEYDETSSFLVEGKSIVLEKELHEVLDKMYVKKKK